MHQIVQKILSSHDGKFMFYILNRKKCKIFLLSNQKTSKLYVKNCLQIIRKSKLEPYKLPFV